MTKAIPSSLLGQIRMFNSIYKLPAASFPQIEQVVEHQASGRQYMPPRLMVAHRIEKFADIMREEVAESEDIMQNLSHGMRRKNGASVLNDEGNTIPYTILDLLTDKADWLGDIIVYCLSEALKYGLPMDEILQIIMESNFSKLGEDGKPIYDERGKVMKGPNYWKPEPKIKALLSAKIWAAEKSKVDAEMDAEKALDNVYAAEDSEAADQASEEAFWAKQKTYARAFSGSLAQPPLTGVDNVCLWPDGTWCYCGDAAEYSYKSDDYEVIPADQWDAAGGCKLDQSNKKD